MKKLFYFILAVMMLFCTAGNVKADVLYARSSDGRVKTYTQFDSATSTLVSSSVIGTNNRIIGYTFSDSAAGDVCLIDASAATTAPATTNVMAEPTVAAGGVTTVIFPLPYQIQNGLVIDMSTATGQVTIYYE